MLSVYTDMGTASEGEAVRIRHTSWVNQKKQKQKSHVV